MEGLGRHRGPRGSRGPGPAGRAHPPGQVPGPGHHHPGRPRGPEPRLLHRPHHRPPTTPGPGRTSTAPGRSRWRASARRAWPTGTTTTATRRATGWAGCRPGHAGRSRPSTTAPSKGGGGLQLRRHRHVAGRAGQGPKQASEDAGLGLPADRHHRQRHPRRAPQSGTREHANNVRKQEMEKAGQRARAASAPGRPLRRRRGRHAPAGPAALRQHRPGGGAPSGEAMRQHLLAMPEEDQFNRMHREPGTGLPPMASTGPWPSGRGASSPASTSTS